MPSKFIVRNLRENGVYHIYNRSSRDEGMFLEPQDYRVFMFYLYIYTSPIEQVIKRFSDLPSRLRNKTLAGKLEVVAYCLMPDHFHLIIKQRQVDAMPQLMKQIANGYTVYYNQKYKKAGPVTQGRYKAVEVDTNKLPDLVRHIHLNPQPTANDYQWSSFKKYLGREDQLDIDIFSLSNTLDTHQKLAAFHADKSDYEESLKRIAKLTID